MHVPPQLINCYCYPFNQQHYYHNLLLGPTSFTIVFISLLLLKYFSWFIISFIVRYKLVELLGFVSGL